MNVVPAAIRDRLLHISFSKERKTLIEQCLDNASFYRRRELELLASLGRSVIEAHKEFGRTNNIMRSIFSAEWNGHEWGLISDRAATETFIDKVHKDATDFAENCAMVREHADREAYVTKRLAEVIGAEVTEFSNAARSMTPPGCEYTAESLIGWRDLSILERSEKIRAAKAVHDRMWRSSYQRSSERSEEPFLPPIHVVVRDAAPLKPYEKPEVREITREEFVGRLQEKVAELQTQAESKMKASILAGHEVGIARLTIQDHEGKTLGEVPLKEPLEFISIKGTVGEDQPRREKTPGDKALEEWMRTRKVR